MTMGVDSANRDWCGCQDHVHGTTEGVRGVTTPSYIHLDGSSWRFAIAMYVHAYLGFVSQVRLAHIC